MIMMQVIKLIGSQSELLLFNFAIYAFFLRYPHNYMKLVAKPAIRMGK